MKRYFYLFLIFFTAFLVGFAHPVQAVTLISPIRFESLGEIITRASSIVTPLAVLGFIFTVIYAGWIRMTAAGDPEKEKKSMKVAIGAAVGFAIIALAPLIVKLLASLLGVTIGI